MKSNQFKTVFIAITGNGFRGNWGKSDNLFSALKNCKASWKDNPLIVMVNFTDDIPDDVFKDLSTCFVVNAWGSVVVASDCTDADHANIEKYFAGYSYIKQREPKQPKTSKK